MTRRDWNAELQAALDEFPPVTRPKHNPAPAIVLDEYEPFEADGPCPVYIAPKPRREWRWLRFIPPPLVVTPELAVLVALVVVLAALLLRALACCVAWPAIITESQVSNVMSFT